MMDFNLPEIIWELYIDDTTWARKSLKNLDNNFMEQVLRELTQKDALLDLLLVNRIDLMNEVEIDSCLGKSLKSLLSKGKTTAKPHLWT